jgi:L-threonylcarbamoyladenylate synthase
MPIQLASNESVQLAAELLRNGCLVAIPTETVYGLAANAFDANAVAQIFSLKQRPHFDPLIVHLADASELESVVTSVPELAKRVIAQFWPGPLTVVLPRRDVVPHLVTSDLETVAVRVPAHPIAQQVIAAVGTPIAAPSANLFGRVSPTTAQHVFESFGNVIPLILDGGPCEIGVESTVLSFVDEVPRLLRPGGVTVETLLGVLGTLEMGESSDASPTAPGQLPAHYAPTTPLEVLASPSDAPPDARWGLLWFGEATTPQNYSPVINLSPSSDFVEAAAKLFAAIRDLDAAGVQRIVVRAVPEVGLGRAIMDRLRRASMGSHASRASL